MNDFNKLEKNPYDAELDYYLETEREEHEDELFRERTFTDDAVTFHSRGLNGIKQSMSEEVKGYKEEEVLSLEEQYMNIETVLKRDCLISANLFLAFSTLIVFSIGTILATMSIHNDYIFFSPVLIIVLIYAFLYKKGIKSYKCIINGGLLNSDTLDILRDKNLLPDIINDITIARAIDLPEFPEGDVCPLSNQCIFNNGNEDINITDKIKNMSLKEQLEYIDSLILKI